tara:strand:+ start:1134 stop:1292 length:159 start_codon:yes stop_codon:yes gene_type:complete
MTTQELRIEILNDIDLLKTKFNSDQIIKSIIQFLPQSQLEELKDSIDRDYLL